MNKVLLPTLVSLMLCLTNTNIAQVYRPLDGFANNQTKPPWGAATTPFLRITGNGFSDGIAAPAGANRSNPRGIFNRWIRNSMEAGR